MTGNISTTAFRWPELLRKGARVHIAGVAGVGMNPLAQALAACGCTVSGSDRFLDQGSELPVLRQLRAAGIALLPQDGSGVTADTALLAVSTAIEPANPDIAAAQRLGIPVAHRSEVLAALTRRGRCIGVAGTSGKTTTTGMTGWILDHAGLRPNVVNGGVILPQYGDANDALAVQQVQAMFPDRRVVGVQTREVAFGGGNIHCITQQQPAPQHR